MSLAELATKSGMAENQIRARASELVKERFATSPKVGFYAAVPHNVEGLLDSGEVVEEVNFCCSAKRAEQQKEAGRIAGKTI